MIKNSLSEHLKDDFSASIIVFFVALPLCLGIALASGVPLFSGIIAGIIGGIVVGSLSGSHLGVSGPAAGLAIIVFTAISLLGSYQAFLLAVVIAGVLQFLMGFFRLGFIAYFFPTSVIHGMLTGIGILIILKQIPHALGYDKDHEGNDAYFQIDGNTTFDAIVNAFNMFNTGAILISLLSLFILILWEKVLLKKHKLFGIIQGPIVVVFFGILMNYLYLNHFLDFSLTAEQMVQIPMFSISDFSTVFNFPDFSSITNANVWKTAMIIALVASTETLLSVEAADKLDPLKRVTPTNQELKAQGVGNIFSGLIGGLPIAQVVVRSSVNISFGAKTKLSTILHGFWLLLSALTLASLLNMIPLSALAAILIVVGYKLAKPTIFKDMYVLGWEQFAPFVITIIVMIVTDLLKGVLFGLFVSLGFVLHHSYKNSYHMKDVIQNQDGVSVHHIELGQEVSFINKASIINNLEAIPNGSHVIIDCTKSKAIAYDVREIIDNYIVAAVEKNIIVKTINYSGITRKSASIH